MTHHPPRTRPPVAARHPLSVKVIDKGGTVKRLADEVQAGGEVVDGLCVAKAENPLGRLLPTLRIVQLVDAERAISWEGAGE